MSQDQTYVALLRSVNVGGRNKIRMADLREGWQPQGLHNVTTYLQSGNLLFTAPCAVPRSTIRETIAAEVEARYGLQVTVLVYSGTHFETLATSPHFAQHDDLSKRHITFLASAPNDACVAAVTPTKYLPDAFAVAGHEVHLYCPNGYGRTRLNNAFWERRLQCVATTRSMKTVRALAEGVKELARLHTETAVSF